MNNSVSSKIFDELFNTIGAIGVDNTLNYLKEAKLKFNEENDIEYIINTISSVTSVKKERILYGVDRNDDRKIAISLCVFFLKKEYNYSFNDLEKILKKDKSTVCKYFSLVENATNTSKSDLEKKISEHKKKINEIIKERNIKKNAK